MADFAYMTSAAMSPDTTASGAVRRVQRKANATGKTNSSRLTGRIAPNTSQPGRMAATDTGIAMDNVTIRRDDKPVIQNLSLKIDSGSITAIVGPSGAGKTTLLASLNGLLQPQAGRIAVGSNALDEPDALREHRLRTSTIFQEHALIDRLSALDNVLLAFADERSPFSILPWGKSLERRAVEALREVGLLHLAHRRAGNLSGGERQRVGIARALVRKPDLLLADEPFSAVDPALARQLSNEFKALVKASGITVVVVLHQIDIARTLADRIVGLTKDGIAFDAPSDQFDSAAHDRLFSITPNH